MPSPLNIITISTNLPRRCGIATFNADVVRELRVAGATVRNISLRRPGEKRRYAAANTLATILENDEAEYAKTALLINRLRPDVVLIQHEFGIFGGRDGVYILELLKALRVPVAVIAHTIPYEEKNDYQRTKIQVLRQIGALSDLVITISQLSQVRLSDVFKGHGITTPVAHIPHGTPDMNVYMNTSSNVKPNPGQLTLSTFGLISERKGIRDVIETLPNIVRHFPHVIYKVLGAPHPADMRAQQYLRHIKRMVKRLGLENNVQFVTRFLSVREIMQSLYETDVYITFYQDPDQASSGTLSYAMAAGCCIVSTPYVHARELLAQGRGVLIPFFNKEVLKDSILNLLRTPALRENYRRLAFQYGQTTAWPRIGKMYYETLASLAAIATPKLNRD